MRLEHRRTSDSSTITVENGALHKEAQATIANSPTLKERSVSFGGYGGDCVFQEATRTHEEEEEERSNLWYSEADFEGFRKDANTQAQRIAVGDRRSAGWQRVLRRVNKVCNEASTEDEEQARTTVRVYAEKLTEVYTQAPQTLGLEHRIWTFLAYDVVYARQCVFQSAQRTKKSPCAHMVEDVIAASSETVTLGSRLLAHELALAQATALRQDSDEDEDDTDYDSDEDSDDD